MQRALLLLLVVAAYLLLAGGPAWTVWLLLVMAGAAALVRPRQTFTLSATPATAAFERLLLAVTAATAAQLVPLPRLARDALSPQAAHARAALHLVAADGWAPLSIDAGLTAVGLATWITGLLTYFAARSVFEHDGGIRRTCRLLAGFGAAAALVAAAQRSATPTLVLGLVPAEAPGARPFGPFVNRNHFAGWLLLLMPIVAGYLMAHLRHHLAGTRGWSEWRHHLTRSAALPLLLSLVVMIAVLLLTLSRSAVLGAGAAALAWWRMARHRYGPEDRLSGLLAGGLIGVALVSAAALVDLDAWAARLEGTAAFASQPDHRLVIWRETLPLVADFWAVGTGVGTYGQAMLTYQQSRIWLPHLAAWAHFNQAHNHYLHALAEGGLLVALPAVCALVLLAVAARRALARDRREIGWVRVGAAAALVGTAVQSLWEIPLVMPANGVMAALAAALVLHDPRARPADSTAEAPASRSPG